MLTVDRTMLEWRLYLRLMWQIVARAGEVLQTNRSTICGVQI